MRKKNEVPAGIRVERIGHHAVTWLMPTPDGPPLITAEGLAAARRINAEMAADPALRSVTLRSEDPKVFLAGADLATLADLPPEDALAMHRRLAEVLQGVQDLPFPVLAAVDGDVTGAGCEALLPADHIVAVEGVHLTFSHARFGALPVPWSLWRLVERVGANRALWLLTSGRSIGTAEAKAIGLVDEVVPDRAALEEHLATLQASMEMVSPAAIRAAKAAIRAVSAHRPGYEKKVAEVFETLLAGPEYREGLAAHLAHRAPEWALEGM